MRNYSNVLDKRDRRDFSSMTIYKKAERCLLYARSVFFSITFVWLL